MYKIDYFNVRKLSDIIVLYIAEIKFARKKKLLDNLLTKYLQNFKCV